MGSKKSTSTPEDQAEALLRSKGRVRAPELVELIYKVNPTGLDLPQAVLQRRYALKSKLQSLLLHQFADDIVIVRVESEEGVVGLHYRPQNRDACHAVVAELDEDARSLVHLRLDTGKLGEQRTLQPSPTKPTNSTKVSSTGATPGDLLQLGRNALAAYDFDKARSCFEQAYEETGSDVAAVALLEFLVDHLAAYQEALDFEEQLDDEPGDEVRALLALAAANVGRADDFTRLAEGNEHPRLAGALLTLAAAAVKENRFEDAFRHLKDARQRDSALPELVTLEAELTKKRSNAREPDEKELERLVAAGDLEAIEKQTQLVLQRWPDSGMARRVLKDVDSRRREQRAQALVKEGDQALQQQDHEKAKRLYLEAVGLGATGLEKKLQEIDLVLQARREDEAVKSTLKLLETLNETSLTQYLALDAPLRERVRKNLHSVVLEWLEELQRGGQAQQDIAAVLALDVVVRRGEAAQPEWVLSTLRPYEERVRRLQVGRLVLHRAQESLKELSEKEAKATLESAELALREGRLEEASQLAARVQVGALGERALVVGAEATGRLEAAQRVQRFEERLKAGKPLEALRVLREAESGQWDDQVEWKKRRKELDKLVRQELHQEVHESAEGIPSPEFADQQLLGEDVTFGLDATGENYYWVTTHGNELFIRRSSLKDGLVHAVVALRLPEKLDFPSVLLGGDVLSVVGNEGALLQLSVANWEVLTWVPGLRVTEGEVIDDVLLAADARHLWLSVREFKANKDSLRIVDLQTGRVQRDLSRDGYRLHLVAQPESQRVFISGRKRNGRLMNPTGVTESTLPAGIADLAPIPGTNDFLVVLETRNEPSEVDEEEDNTFGPGSSFSLGRISREKVTPLLPGELDDADEDGVLALATSHATNTVFIRGQMGEDSLLSAYDFTVEPPKRLWRVEIPRRAELAQDINGLHLCLVSAGPNGPNVIKLGRKKPTLVETAPAWAPPKLTEHDWCEPTWGQHGLAMRMKDIVSDVARMKVLNETLENAKDVGQLVQLVSEFRRNGPQKEAAVAADFVRKHHGDSAMVQMDQVQELTEQESWESALDFAKKVDTEELKPDALAHLHHLKALALYQLGKLDEATKQFWECFRLGAGRCAVGEWPQWLEALENPKVKGTEAANLLGRIRRADAALEKGDGAAALRELDTFEVWSSFDVQSGARLVEAMSKTDPSTAAQRIRRRLINAAFLDEYQELQGDHWRVLPLGEMARSKEKLEAIALGTRQRMAGGRA